MWLLSPEFFVSVVAARMNVGRGPVDPAKLMVRARLREHLVALQTRCPKLASAPILTTAGDYRYRIIVDKSDFSAAVAKVVSDIDYCNFKNAAAASGKANDTYVKALHKVWADLREIQT
jgi:hypothetical protein